MIFNNHPQYLLSLSINKAIYTPLFHSSFVRLVMNMASFDPTTSRKPEKRFLMTFCPGRYQNLEDFFDYGHIRYHTLLSHNPHYPSCEENRRLRNLYDAIELGDHGLIDVYSTHCSLLFMDYVRKRYEKHLAAGPEGEDFASDAYTAVKLPLVKIQVRTVNSNNDMEFSTHSSKLTYPTTSPINNIFRGIPTVLHQDIEILEEIWREIFRVRISGSYYCLKTIYHYFDEDAFCREIKSLQRVPIQANISCLVAVVAIDAGPESKVDGIVLKLVDNAKVLSKAVTVEKTSANRWKSQIADAMVKLHERGIIWGNAAVENVIIDEDQNAVVVDFAGGQERISKGADIEGLSRIFEFVDECAEEDICQDQMDEVLKLDRYGL